MPQFCVDLYFDKFQEVNFIHLSICRSMLHGPGTVQATGDAQKGKTFLESGSSGCSGTALDYAFNSNPSTFWLSAPVDERRP